MKFMSKDLKDSAASVLNDPFNRSSMVGLSTYCSVGYDGRWSYRGTVKFKNGDTEGEQNFKGDSLNALLVKMQAFVETLDEEL